MKITETITAIALALLLLTSLIAMVATTFQRDQRELYKEQEDRTERLRDRSQREFDKRQFERSNPC